MNICQPNNCIKLKKVVAGYVLREFNYFDRFQLTGDIWDIPVSDARF
ncbi:MAG: hypothetical protein ACE5IY_05005 [bacterium]